MPYVKVIEVYAQPDMDGCEGLLAIVFTNSKSDQRYTPGPVFITPPSASLQVAFMRYMHNHKVEAHRHPPQERTIRETGEVILVTVGSVKVDLYTSDGMFQNSQVLMAGDLIILYSGGHSLTILEDKTEILEVKQGPYNHSRDKVPLHRHEPVEQTA